MRLVRDFAFATVATLVLTALLLAGTTGVRAQTSSGCWAHLKLAPNRTVDFKTYCDPPDQGDALELIVLRSQVPIHRVTSVPLVDGVRGVMRCGGKDKRAVTCRVTDASSAFDETVGHVVSGRLKVKGHRCEMQARMSYVFAPPCFSETCPASAIGLVIPHLTPRGCG